MLDDIDGISLLRRDTDRSLALLEHMAFEAFFRIVFYSLDGSDTPTLASGRFIMQNY